jgi:hypothetical protein
MAATALLSGGIILAWSYRMRRLSGIYDGVEHIILEYDPLPGGGIPMLECPSTLQAVLAQRDGTVPTGAALDAACRTLFGDTFQVREV